MMYRLCTFQRCIQGPNYIDRYDLALLEMRVMRINANYE